MKKNSIIDVFFALLRGGLWEEDVCLSSFGEIEFSKVYNLAEEQSVVGLIAAGIEHVKDVKIAQEVALLFVGTTLRLEQSNKSMNDFVARLIVLLRKKDIYALLVKGQGIAECYERPRWRACGDIDLFLSDDNYENAKVSLLPIATSIEEEGIASKHFGMIIDDYNVELHGTLSCGLSFRIDKILQDLKNAIIFEGNVRSWLNGKTQVFLPAANEDVVYVFTHILSHYYKGGVGLRQICDWCRLLWTYRDSLNHGLLETRLRQMGLMSEWKAFGSFAVEYLGMHVDAMPFYSYSRCWRKKAERMCSFILKVGNFGHNRDMSFYHNGSFLVQKIKSFGRRCGDMFRHFKVFPIDTIRFAPCILYNGLRSAIRGE